MRPAAFIQAAALITLSVASILFASGCFTEDNDPVINHTVIPYMFGVDIWNVCVPDPALPGLPPMYTRYTVQVNPDGSTRDLDDEHDSDLSDCDYSVGTEDEVDPSAVQASFGGTTTNPSIGQVRPKATTTSSFHPVNALPYMRPVPFMPIFSSAQAGSSPANCDPNGSFYAVNHGASNLTHYASCTLKVLASIPLFGNPLHPALTPDGSLLLVTDNAGAVDFVSTSTDTVVYTLMTPGMFPSGIAISPDGNTAYVTNYDINALVMVIDIPSRTITGTIPLPVHYPKQIFLTPDGAQAWVNFYSNSSIYIIDTLSQTIAGSIGTIFPATTGMAFNATGSRAFVAVYPQDVYVYDTATLARLADITVGANPVDIVLTPDTQRLYVTSYGSSTITVIDAHHNTVLTTITAPGVDQRAFSLASLVP